MFYGLNNIKNVCLKITMFELKPRVQRSEISFYGGPDNLKKYFEGLQNLKY